MANPNQQRIVVDLENVEVLPGNWRNFKGEKRQYNSEGVRNFNVKLEEPIALAMIEQGWNIKEFRQQQVDDGEHQGYFMKVNVNFGFRPPSIYVITSGGKNQWREDMIGALDDLEITNADIQLVSRPHDMNGGGISAYLRKAFFVLYEDALDLKWAHLNTEVSS